MPTTITGTGGVSQVQDGAIQSADFATPLYEASLTTNGYQKLPSGLIIQWGISASVANGGGRTVTFPIAFPNACFSASLIGTANGSAGELNHTITGLTTTTLTFNNNSTTTQPFRWMAIGY